MLFKTLALALLAVGLVQGETIYDHVEEHADEDLATLLAALEATKGIPNTDESLQAILDNPDAGKYTLFAPIDTAFADVPVDDLLCNDANKAILADILNYHVVPPLDGDLHPLTNPVPTELAGETLEVVKGADGVPMTVNGADVDPDPEHSPQDLENGAIWEINKVLLPPTFSLDALTACG
ncbi:unnamed protein product [Vitrella brassicaformis CCMP3155]|uniref:FAS1 domain-containing protein n=2 Tax=Vitrella brassicaformis TaxID=1169539 RepID=A0A0G4FMZ1_VITBC|nr:unnamed protein product [Vitrella brassicaformis CCMP3155]|mmetsp:Transcript_19881/g.48237  ORF Transcript_19881/g.48237 Transcript_19881/m.48237 type:complete len:181 (+) Transcript_19881:123-665(+)|eukprot:CEM14945.1 unnamed protein product [Vitrella brassicaformis CCMP3155]